MIATVLLMILVHVYTCMMFHTAIIHCKYLDCYDGNIRLMGGNNSLEGRVEICQNDKYYTVCDDLWDEFEARVVCNQLNYTGTGLC